jgi:hypothetical protein
VAFKLGSPTNGGGQMKIIEQILIEQLEVRITVLDVIEQSCGRSPKYLCEMDGKTYLFSEHTMQCWRETAASWRNKPLDPECKRKAGDL